jgi:hypothetical protein
MDGDLLSHRTNKGQHQADKMDANHQQHNKSMFSRGRACEMVMGRKYSANEMAFG